MSEGVEVGRDWCRSFRSRDEAPSFASGDGDYAIGTERPRFYCVLGTQSGRKSRRSPILRQHVIVAMVRIAGGEALGRDIAPRGRCDLGTGDL